MGGQAVSLDEQHAASERAAGHRAKAEQLISDYFLNEAHPAHTDVQFAVGLLTIAHLLLAIEDRLNYGSQSVLDGTVSCRICRVIVLEENARGHNDWHALQALGPQREVPS